jgi:hypothetical protein
MVCLGPRKRTVCFHFKIADSNMLYMTSIYNKNIFILGNNYDTLCKNIIILPTFVILMKFVNGLDHIKMMVRWGKKMHDKTLKYKLN